MSAPSHVQAATLERFLDAWKRWNADDMLAIFADDFTQVTLPFGMGVPERQRGAVEQVLPVLVGIVSDYKVCCMIGPKSFPELTSCCLADYSRNTA